MVEWADAFGSYHWTCVVRSAVSFTKIGYIARNEKRLKNLIMGLRNIIMDNAKFDCCFNEENRKFRYRAAAIIIENECVLLASNETNDYLYSVGGGVHMGENSEEAVIREVFEETGIRFEIARLAFIHENFFVEDDMQWHEIAFYYLMKPRGTQQLNCNSITQGVREYMNWIPINRLKEYKAFPTFFADKLSEMSLQVEHIITNEE